MAKVESYKLWSADEVKFLHDNYGKMTADELATALNRTKQSVWEKCAHEGLRKHAQRHVRTPEGPWHCPRCEQTKPIDQFGKSASGKGSAYCKQCTNEIQRERRKLKKEGK